jgi:hypothetical protein
MASLFQKVLRRLRFKFIDGPKGKGVPVPIEIWDQQFRDGFWSKLDSPAEMGHYAVSLTPVLIPPCWTSDLAMAN